jgi:hypothetical protein
MALFWVRFIQGTIVLQICYVSLKEKKQIQIDAKGQIVKWQRNKGQKKKLKVKEGKR